VPAFGPVRFYRGCVQADNLPMDVGVPIFLIADSIIQLPLPTHYSGLSASIGIATDCWQDSVRQFY